MFGVTISAAVASSFVYLWYNGRNDKMWAIYTGFIIYLLDLLPYIFFKDWVKAGGHIFVLIFILGGIINMKKNAA